MLLTALLAVLLTAGAPVVVESCCLPNPMPASCCAGKCDCHLTSPSVPQPAAQTPATLHAASDALLPAFASEFLPEPARNSAVAIFTSVGPAQSPPYLLTHAFLI
jgi:hypothetical protein